MWPEAISPRTPFKKKVKIKKPTSTLVVHSPSFPADSPPAMDNMGMYC
jgi:hypothetical protein